MDQNAATIYSVLFLLFFSSKFKVAKDFLNSQNSYIRLVHQTPFKTINWISSWLLTTLNVMSLRSRTDMLRFCGADIQVIAEIVFRSCRVIQQNLIRCTVISVYVIHRYIKNKIISAQGYYHSWYNVQNDYWNGLQMAVLLRRVSNFRNIFNKFCENLN